MGKITNNELADNYKARVICTSTTRPSNPTSGLEIYETDTMNNYTWNDSAWENKFTTHLAESATETVKGHVELATAAETTTGTDDTRAVHPAGLKVELDKKASLSNVAWEKIAETTLGSNAAQVDFASISSDYRYLKILFSIKSSVAGYRNIYLRLNDDTSSIYDYIALHLIGGTALSQDANVNGDRITLIGAMPGSARPFNFGEIEISNVSATENKKVLHRYYSSIAIDLTGIEFYSGGGIWRNTVSKISKISLIASADSLILGSTFALWGCK